jgi:hypothetical protein
MHLLACARRGPLFHLGFIGVHEWAVMCTGDPWFGGLPGQLTSLLEAHLSLPLAQKQFAKYVSAVLEALDTFLVKYRA